MKAIKVLITHPDFNDPGGVANYYKKLANKFKIPVKHFIIGSRPEEHGVINSFFRLLTDFIVFFITMITYKPDVVHVNPSLDFKSFLRDSMFLLIAKIFRKKTIVFYRGLNPSFQEEISKTKMWLYRYVLRNTDASIVLSKKFYETLISWGYVNSIYREVTVIDDEALNGLKIHELFVKRTKREKWIILFLARIIKEKGIYETIDAFRILQKKHSNFELNIAGDGEELKNVEKYVCDNSIENINFKGYVKGDEKSTLFENANIFCFPSYWGEGMPNSVIEAMAFGLPVVTRSVGGLVDFFKNKKHGFITGSKDPEEFAGFIEKLYQDKNLYENISNTNYLFAQEKFLASGAAKRLEDIYKSITKK